MVTDMVRRGTSQVDSGLSITEENSAELMQSGEVARARAEMEGAIIVAKKFPRNEDEARQKLMRSCDRPRFADEVCYIYKRGETEVKGLSVYYAREAARIWGNIRYGAYIVRDDDDTRHVRSWAWDIETNTKVEVDDTFRKLVQRKRGGTTTWVTPDERDLRELTNNRAAKSIRNCILALLPEDLKAECEERADATLNNAAAGDPDAERKRVLDAFGRINIPVSELERYLGHKLQTATPAEIAKLRQIWKSLSEGNATWAEYAPAVDAAAPAGPVTNQSLKNGRTTTSQREKPAAAANADKPATPPPSAKAEEAFLGLSEAIKAATAPESVDAIVERCERARDEKTITQAQFAELTRFANEQINELTKQ